MRAFLKTLLSFLAYTGLLASAYASSSDEESLDSRAPSEISSAKTFSDRGFTADDTASIASRSTASDRGIEKRGQKLNQIIALKAYFKRGALEITPQSYKTLLGHTSFYGIAFETYDRGIALRGWSDKDDIEGLLTLSRHFFNLKAIKCFENTLSSKTLLEIVSDMIQHYEAFEMLDLAQSVLSQEDIKELLDVLPNPASLKLLNIKASVLSSQAQSEIKKKHPNLAEFIVESETKELIVKPEPKAVTEALQDDKSQALVRSQPPKKVTKEDIFDALIKVKQKSLSIETFAALLKSDPTFTSLILHSKKIGDEGGKALAQALQGNTSLKELNLSFNDIGDEGGKALAQALQGNTSLKELYLHNNNIGDEGLKALAQALKGNTSLQTLWLGSNNIGDEGGKALAQALQGNSSLQTLDLRSNNIGEEGESILQKLKENNPTLQIWF